MKITLSRANGLHTASAEIEVADAAAASKAKADLHTIVSDLLEAPKKVKENETITEPVVEKKGE